MNHDPSIALGNLFLLFADDVGIAASPGVVRTVHAARTFGAPTLEAERLVGKELCLCLVNTV